MSVQEFSSKRTRWLAITFLVVGVSTLIAWGGVQIFAEIPFEAEWASSGHADDLSEAFRHWDGDDPPLVSTRCAKCHSGLGFQDFMGADGTDAGTVENAAQPSVITCVSCHNDATKDLDSVVFPSGAEVAGLDASAICMQCHQGRKSMFSVDDAIADANVPDDDTVGGMSFQNIHYAGAGATLMGGEVMGGYQYADKSYDVKFAHVEGIDTCISCHDPHSLEVEVDKCTTCHAGVASHEDLANIRYLGSTSDYDGDGDVTEGINAEIAGLQDILYPAIQDYVNTVYGINIAYPGSGSYFYEDTNGNGVIDDGEDDRGNRFRNLTARLYRAYYNYIYVVKDPGAYVHNGKYVIQVLHDSLADLGADMTGKIRP